MTTERSAIDFHRGKLLMLAAKQYPGLQDALLEIVQNAVDGRAKHIGVRLDRKRRSINVFDDGKGASIEKFNNALASIGDSEKGEDDLGQFGLGLVSPIDKCEKMTFTSCPLSGENGYVEWTFVGDDIVTQKDKITIPRVALSNLRFGRESRALTIDGKTVSQVDWRTKMTLTKYTSDRAISKISSIDDLAAAIFTRYGLAMRKQDTFLTLEFISESGESTVRRNLQAPEYTGEKLPQHVVYEDGSRTFFNLYLAQANARSKGRGIVSLGIQGGSPFRFPFKELASRTHEHLVPEVVTALNSGVFEGEILSTTATLHENRKQFVVNQGLILFSKALTIWYQEVGAAHVQNVEESRKDERYQQLGLESMRNIEAMLKTKRFAHLASLLNDFKKGTVGKQHGRSKVEQPAGMQLFPSVSTQGGVNGNDANKHPYGAKSRDVPAAPQNEVQPKEGHHPHTVAGPRGQHRALVTGGSFGLQFAHEIMHGESRLWVFNEEEGTLYFNVRHPTWVSCESSDKRLMQLQELVAVHALHWIFCQTNLKNAMLLHVNETIDTQAFLLLHSAAFNSGAGKKVAE